MFGVRLPDLPDSETLHEHWQELGCAVDSFDGLKPFSWSEIDAYSRLTGADLCPVEAQCLVDMSRAYARLRTDTNPLSIEPMERANG